ncbi:MAG: nucleotidyltransferase family protein [Steroidobacteraceae bacterium]
MNSRTLVILAAGLGTRFGGPKQLTPVTPEGETLLDFTLHDALAAGVSEFVFILRRELEAETLRRFAPRLAGRAGLRWVCQEAGALPAGLAARQRPWGTGAAVLSARDAVNGHFWVLNADDFYGRETFLSMAAAPQDTWTLAGFELGNTLAESGGVSRAQCLLDRDGFLQAIRECREVRREGDGITCKDWLPGWPALDASTPVSMNFWGFDQRIFAALQAGFTAFAASQAAGSDGEFNLPDAVGLALQQGSARVRVVPAAGPWIGLTHPEDLAEAAQHIAALRERGVYPARLW